MLNEDAAPPEGPITNDAGYVIVDSVATTGKKAKIILHPMTVDFPEGTVTAIMGPSGSGKTTFLDFVTGALSGVSAVGDVNLPGSNAYVPQDDRLHGFYTCHEYMRHYARLSGLSNDDAAASVSHGKRKSLTRIKDWLGEKEAHIMEIFDALGLSAHKDTIVGDIFIRGLSGGQKRRLSVALEALSSPKNFFLDEPTSGLDSESAYQLLKFLKDYAQKGKGRRVILTIHQPSSFIWNLIDNVVLLSKGKLVYQGPRKNMESFFEHCGHPTPPEYNPADHYVTAVNDEFSLHSKDADTWAADFQEWAKQHHTTREHKRLSVAVAENVGIEDPERGQRPSFASTGRRRSSVGLFFQPVEIGTSRSGGFFTAVELTRRYFKNLFFNPGILGTRIAMYVMLSLVIGALFWDLGSNTTYPSIQSRTALLFYCVAFFVFMSVAVLPFTVLERGIVNKEVQNGYYHPALYQAAQAVSSIPGTALLAFLTTLIILTMTKLNEPYWYFLNMFLALNCAEALAQLVSHVVPHFIIGMALIAALYGLFMILQGFMIIPSDFPVWLKWSYKCAFHTYSWRTFMYKEFSGQTFPDAEAIGFGTGEDVLKVFEIENVDPAKDMVVLICYAAIIHLLSFLVLHVKWILEKRTRTDIDRVTPEDLAEAGR